MISEKNIDDLKLENEKLKQENQELKNWNEKYLSELKRWGYPETPIHISEYEKLKKMLKGIEKDLSYIVELGFELYEFPNGCKILGVDITNSPSQQ